MRYAPPMLHLPSATVDLDALVLSRDGVEHVLTEQEGQLLAYLAARPGEVVSRQELLTEVLGYAPRVVTRAIDATVSRLRAKLERDPRHPESLVAVRGKGYRLHVVEGAEVGPTHAPAVDEGPVLGRADEQQALAHCVDGGGIVQLLGPGGVGKTTLARALLADRGGHFVDLAPARRLEEIPTALSAALGVPLTRTSAADSLLRLADLLAVQRPAVVVFDNVEQLPDGVIDSLRALRSEAGVPFLVTSREPIAPDLPTLRLGPLPADAARRILVRTARHRAAGWSPDDDDALDALADAVDRLPLALEMVGAQLPALPADLLRGRLEQLLHRGDGRTGRHASLAATVAWSWNGLHATDRRRLAWWSTFRRALPVAAAESIGPHDPSVRFGVDDESPPSVLETVLRLQDASLLDPSARAGLRPWGVVRAFASEQLSAAGEREAAEEAHARWLLTHLPDDPERCTGAERRAAVDWVLAWREDLTAALDRLQHRRPDLAARLGLGLLLADRRMGTDHSDAIVARTLTAADRTDDLGLQVRARLVRAHRSRTRSHLEGSEAQALDEARERLEAIDDDALWAAWGNLAGNRAKRAGHVERALEHYRAARAAAQRGGLLRRQGMLDHDEGATRRRMGQREAARTLLLSAIASHRATGDLRLEALSSQSLAVLLRQGGDEAGALALGTRAIEAARGSGDPYALGEALSAQANALTQAGRSDEARATLEEALRLHRLLGNVVALSYTLGNLGALDEHDGHPLDAELRTREALDLATRSGVPYAAAFWRFRLAQLAHQRGALDVALPLYEQAIAELDAHRAVPQVHQARAFAAIAHAEAAPAERARFEALLAAATPLGEGGPHDRAVVGMARALVAQLAGDAAAREVLNDEGLDLAWVEAEPLLGPLRALWARLVDQGV